MNKNELIEEHISLAQIMAKRKKKFVKSSVYYEELESAAYRGLVDAAQSYDHTTPFENFACIRINGEMNDYLRELSWGKNNVKVLPLKVDVAKNDNNDDIFDYLDEEGKTILTWYYKHGYSMKEIGKFLDASESFVSLLMKKYKKKMSREIAKWN